MSRKERERAHPPETLEGWYSLHDSYVLRDSRSRDDVLRGVATTTAEMTHSVNGNGWSAVISLVGGPADLLVIHFRDRIEALENARAQVAATTGDALQRGWSQLGVTEAGLYHITAAVAKQALERGGEPGDPQFQEEIARRAAVEQESDHVRRRLYPELPPGMGYVSFYPMSKRRDRKQNWYALSLEERSRLMHAHGTTGRKYAGRVLQIITGAIGLSEWEWGVTLFTRDLLEVKRLVTDMRFDEVSAEYADFGDFYVGRVVSA